MTTPTMDVLDVIRKRAADSDTDFLRETLAVVLRAVMDADVSRQIGAGLHEHTPDRAGPVTQTDRQYTGQRRESADSALGLYNYRARFYSTVLGRFLSSDPSAGLPPRWPGDNDTSSDARTSVLAVDMVRVGKTQRSASTLDLQRYSYAGKNPVVHNDTSGLCFAWGGRLLPCTSEDMYRWLACAGGYSGCGDDLIAMARWAVTTPELRWNWLRYNPILTFGGNLFFMFDRDQDMYDSFLNAVTWFRFDPEGRLAGGRGLGPIDTALDALESATESAWNAVTSNCGTALIAVGLTTGVRVAGTATGATEFYAVIEAGGTVYEAALGAGVVAAPVVGVDLLDITGIWLGTDIMAAQPGTTLGARLGHAD